MVMQTGECAEIRGLAEGDYGARTLSHFHECCERREWANPSFVNGTAFCSFMLARAIRIRLVRQSSRKAADCAIPLNAKNLHVLHCRIRIERSLFASKRSRFEVPEFRDAQQTRKGPGE